MKRNLYTANWFKHGQPKWLLLLLVFFAFSIASSAQTTSWKGITSTWALATNWTNGIPTSAMDVIIGDANFTGTSNPGILSTSTFRGITIGGVKAATVDIKARTVQNVILNVNGTLQIGKGTLTITGNWTRNGGTYSTHNQTTEAFAGIAQTIGGTVATVFKKPTINAGSTVTFFTNFSSGNGLTVAGSLIPDETLVPRYTAGSLTVASGGILKVNALLFSSNYGVTPVLNAGSSVEYSSTTNQTILSLTYSTLIISGGGVKSLEGNLPNLQSSTTAIGKIMVRAGSLDLKTFTANRGTSTVGGVFSVDNGAFLLIGGLTTNFFPANFQTYTLSLTSTVNYYGGGTQLVSSQTYGNLYLTSATGAAVKTFPATVFIIAGNLTSVVGTGTSVSYSAASNITISGNVDIGVSTTFNGLSQSISVGGNWVNNGTLTGSTSTITLTGPGSTISGTGLQNFNNLSVNAAGVVASSAQLTLSGNFATVNVGSFTHVAGNTLTMTGATKTITGNSISLGNLTVSGSVTTTSTMLVSGNFLVSGSFSASTGNITLSGATKTISGAGTMGFFGLLIPGTVTTASSFSVSNALDISGTFSASLGTVTFLSSVTLNGTANLYNGTLNGTSLLLSTNSVLGISNIFTITAGSLNVTAAIPNTVNFNGTGAQNIPSATYNQLVVSNGNTKTASGAITTNGLFTISTGTTFNASTFTHTINSNFLNNGTFTAGTSTVQFAGNSDVNITGATTFNTLTVNKSALVNVLTLNSNISAATVNMTSGLMKTGSNTLTITTTRDGNGTILGIIKRVHAFTAGVGYAFANPSNTILFASVSGVTNITVTVSLLTIADFDFGSAINREYLVSIPVGTYNATLRLHYEDVELNGNSESVLVLWQNAGSSWVNINKSTNNTTSNFVEQSGLINLSNRYTLSNIPNVLRWNGSVSTAWSNASNWTVIQGTPGIIPNSNDVVQLGQSAIVNQPTISTAANGRNIEFGSFTPITLTLASGGSLNLAGNLSGKWTANTIHTINAGAQNITLGGNLTLSDGIVGRSINLNVSTGIITLSGTLTQTGGANIVFTGAGSIYIGANFDYTSGTFTAGLSTIYYNGSITQALAGITYYNIVINKAAGVANLNAAVTVNNNLNITTGELLVNANINLANDLIIGVPGTIRCGAVSIFMGGNLNNGGTFIPGSSTIEFNGTGSQSISLATFYNISINKPVGNALFTGSIDVYGDFAILAGNISLVTNTVNRTSLGGKFTLADGASLAVAGANNFPRNYSLYVIGATSTVIYEGAVAQNVLGITYGNLQFSNGAAAAKTLLFSATVAGNLTVNPGATFSSSVFTITLLGNWINNGTFTPSTGAVLLYGISKTITGNTVFNRLTVYGIYVAATANITSNELLIIIAGGSFTVGTGTSTIHGDLTNSGTLTSGGTTTFTGLIVQNIRLIGALVSSSTGVINFNGNISPVLNSTSTPQFATLNINNTAGVNPSVGWSIFVSFNINAGGVFNGGVQTHTIYGAFNNSGTVTSDGVLFFTPSVARTITLGGTNFSSTGQVNFGGSGALTVAGTPTLLTDVVISNTAGVTPSVNWTVTGNFTIFNGGIFNATTRLFTVAGDFASDGTLNGGTSVFTLSSPAGQISGSTATTFYDLVISGSITATSDFNIQRNFTNNNSFDASAGAPNFTGSIAGIISGAAVSFNLSAFTVAKSAGIAVTLNKNITNVISINVQSGIFNTSTFTITQDASIGADNLLSVEQGGTISIGGNNSVPAFTAYLLDSLSTVEFSGITQSIPSTASLVVPYGHLKVSAAGTKTAAGIINVRSDLIITDGVFVPGNFIDTLGGNWLMTGGTYTNTSNTFVLNGGNDQQITSTGAFNNIKINKTQNHVLPGSDITINGTLTFTLGKIKTGDYTVAMGISGIVSGASQSTGWVFGKLRKFWPVLTNNSQVYEIGDTLQYVPPTILIGSVTTAGNITISAPAGEHPLIATSNIAQAYNVNRHWKFTNAGTAFSNATITFRWINTDVDASANTTLFNISVYNGSTWSQPASANATALTIQATGLSSFGEYAIGEACSNGVWLGGISTDWNVAGNWMCNGIPTSSSNVIIHASATRYPAVTSGIGYCRNITIQTGVTVTISGGELQVAGSINNNGTFTASNGTIHLIGTTAQTIPSGAFTTNTIKNLTINNTAGVTLAGSLNLTNILRISAGSIASAGFLTLKSTALNTARIARITSVSPTPVTGNVTVERFIPGRRKYRLVGSSVTTSASTVLIGGQEPLSIWGNWQNQGVNTTPNVGTLISGGSSADGFDGGTTNASLFNYDAVNKKYIGHSSVNGKNTKYTPLKAGIAFYMFVYGDRRNSVFSSTPFSTVLTAAGTLLMGDQTYNPSSTIPVSGVAERFTLLGNPYACSVDWETIQKTNVSATYWGWDPNLSSTGGYVTVTATGSGVLVAPISGLVQVGRFIQPGQGFFVKTLVGTPELKIREIDKVEVDSNYNSNIFRTTSSNLSTLAVNLLYPSGASTVLADGLLNAFDSNYSDLLNDEDAIKMQGAAECIGIKKNEELLMIEARKLPSKTDTIFLNSLRLSRPQYTIQIFGNNLSASGMQAFLEDVYTNLKHPLSLADTNNIIINTTADAASKDVNRFRIILKPASSLPVTYTSVSAMPKQKEIEVKWQVSSEAGIIKYEIEKSGEGRTFTKAGEVMALGTGNFQTYQWTDLQPVIGKNYYQVKAIQPGGNYFYSKIVIAQLGAGKNIIKVYPNPVKDHQLFIQITHTEKSIYYGVLVNSLGQVIQTFSIEHNGSSTSYKIKLSNDIAVGNYRLRIKNNTETYEQSLIIN